MKRKLQMIISASAASLLSFSTLAQNTPIPRTDGSDRARDSIPPMRTDRLNDVAKSSDIIGIAVKNYQDEKLGKVTDLAVDVESGRIVAVIMSSGGSTRGYGETTIAVPPSSFHHDAAQKVLRLDSDHAKLNGAPPFDSAKWDEFTQSNRVVEVYSYYGQRPYFVAGTAEFRTINADGKLAETLPRNLDGTINTDAARTVDKSRNVEAVRNLEQNNNTVSTRNPDGTWSHVYSPNGEGAKGSWSRLGYVQKASKLVGAPVRNLQDEKLGKVENLAVDISSGRIVAIILSSGGFLGMGDELSAVPPTALRLNAAHDTLQLDATKATLASSPHFKSKQWPDFSQTGYADSVYRAYNVEPYFATDADNTRLNVRDRDSRTLTPLNQGNNQADLDTTAQIRKAIVAEKGLSINARNVKIITVNGRVTLRGPVKTPEERRLIGEIAERVAQSGNVDNQLEAKLPDTSN